MIMQSNLHKVFSTLKTKHDVRGEISTTSSFSTYFYNFREAVFMTVEEITIKIKNSKIKTYIVLSNKLKENKIRISNSNLIVLLKGQLKPIRNDIKVTQLLKITYK